MLWLIVAGVATIFLAHTAPFPFLLERMAPGEALWRMPVNGDARQIYLTFDDGPNPTATPLLLDVLSELDARATFFLIDAHLTADTAPMVRRMFAEGHAVGLHSDTRALMVKTPDDFARTLERQARRIESLAGGRPCRLFRPHAGWRSGSMYEGLKQIDFRLVGWSFGLWDFNWYRTPDPHALAARLARRAEPGDIVVMHDGHHVNPRANREHTVTAVRHLIPAVRARGLQLAPLCVPP